MDYIKTSMDDLNSKKKFLQCSEFIKHDILNMYLSTYIYDEIRTYFLIGMILIYNIYLPII